MTVPAHRAFPHAHLSFPLAVRNQVLLALVIAAVAAAVNSGFVVLAANRLLSGRPIALWAAAGATPTIAIAVLGGLLLAASLSPPSKPLHCAVAALAGLLLLLVLATLGEAAHRIAAGAGRAARVSPGLAFWVIAACTALAIIDALQRLGAGPALRLLVVVVIGGVIAALAAAHIFGSLSIAREYASRQQLFAAALVRHMALVGGSVVPALLIGLPLGVAATRAQDLQGPLFAVLNTLQTVPSIALFALLIAPFSALAAASPFLVALGVGGIGPAPAIVALVLYALLPIVRNTVAGLSGVDPTVIDAARGMGLSSGQILWLVELPLALPVLLAGLRIVVVQTIGLAVVAALIGAGGLGTFVFEGLGQYAIDLVLLGALPAIFLALAADFLLRTLAALLPGSAVG